MQHTYYLGLKTLLVYSFSTSYPHSNFQHSTSYFGNIHNLFYTRKMDAASIQSQKLSLASSADLIPKGHVSHLRKYYEQLALTHAKKEPLLEKSPTLHKPPILSISQHTIQETQTHIFLSNTDSFCATEQTTSINAKCLNFSAPVLASATTALSSIQKGLSCIDPFLTFLYSQHPSKSWKHPIPIIGREGNTGPFVSCCTLSNAATEKALNKASKHSITFKDKLRSWFNFRVVPKCFQKNVNLPLLNFSSKNVATYLTFKDAQYWYQMQLYMLANKEKNENGLFLKEMSQVYNKLYCRTKEILFRTGRLINQRTKHTQKLIGVCERLLRLKNYASFIAMSMAIYDFHKTRPYLLLKRDIRQLDRLMHHVHYLQSTAKNSDQPFSVPFITPSMQPISSSSAPFKTFGFFKGCWNSMPSDFNSKEFRNIAILFSTPVGDSSFFTQTFHML